MWCNLLIDRRLTFFISLISLRAHTDNKFPHHKTGHYRNKSSKIWDPHPQYEILVDGHKFVLNLRPESDHVAPNLEVSICNICYHH